MHKIMILGAGTYQVPLIVKARRLGYETIVTSIEGNYPGFQYADHVYFADTTDYETILEIAKREKIDAITTIGTDVAIRSIGHVCSELKLPGIQEETAILTTDKKLMKECFVTHKVRTPAFRTIRDFGELRKFFADMNDKIVVKSVDRSGSKGITTVTSDDQLQSAYDLAFANTYKDYIIAEEFVEGRKITVEAAVVDGRLVYTMPNGDILFHGRVDIPIGHYTPAGIDDKTLRRIEHELTKAIDALGLDQCGLNADIILKEGHPYILEIGARGGGTNLAELVSATYDIDYYEYILQLALGDRSPSINFIPKYSAACEVLCAPTSGTLKTIGLKSENPHIVDFHTDFEIGERVKKFEVGSDRIGHIVVKCDDNENALSILDEIKKELILEIIPEGDHATRTKL